MFRAAHSHHIRLLALLFCTACSAPEERDLIDHFGRNDLSAKQLRAKLRESFPRRLDCIARATNAALEQSTDSGLRTRILQFRIRASTAFRGFNLLPDALAACYEQWSFSLQLADFVESDSAEVHFGPTLPLYRDCTQELIAIAREEWSEIVLAENQTSTWKQLEVWASENPLVGPNLVRRGVWSDLAKLLSDSNLGILGVAASLQDTIDDVVERLSLQLQFMPLELRWTTDLYLESLHVEPRLAGTMTRLEGLDQSVARLASLEERLPALLQEQRRAVFEESRPEIDRVLAAVAAEREAISALVAEEHQKLIAEVSAQRTSMLEAVNLQRTESLQEVDRQRLETLAWVKAERAQLVATIDQQVSRLERRIETALDHSDGIAERRIQQILWGSGVLLGLFFVLGTAAAWFIKSRVRGR